MAHNLQLVVNDGFKLNETYDKLINKVSKDIVSRAKKSQIIAESLREFNKKMLNKNVTRWNSILFMVSSVLKITPADFKAIRDSMPSKPANKAKIKLNFNLTNLEREMLSELKEVLELFEWATDEFQSNLVSVSRVWPAINTLKFKLLENIHLKNYTTDLRRTLHTKLCTRFDYHLESELFLIATFLDPNFGEKAFDEEKRRSVRQLVKDKLVNSDSTIQTPRTSGTSVNSAHKSSSKYVLYQKEQILNREIDKYDLIIDKYLEFSDTEVAENIDTLSFWKTFQSQLVDLANLAKQYLGVPASSAGVERMFSIAGHIFSVKRRRMGTQLFSELVFLKLNENLM
jgi:hypothetical protein